MSPCFISGPLLILSVSGVKPWLTACGQLVGDLGLCCATRPIRREGSAAAVVEGRQEGRKKGGMNLTNQGEGQVRWAESPIPKCTTCSAGLYRGAENGGQRPGNRQFRGAPTLRKVLLGLFPVVPGVLDSSRCPTSGSLQNIYHQGRTHFHRESQLH